MIESRSYHENKELFLKWFVQTEQQFLGPFTTYEITEKISKNELKGKVQVWNTKDKVWKSINEYNLFFKKAEKIVENQYLVPAQLKNKNIDQTILSTMDLPEEKSFSDKRIWQRRIPHALTVGVVFSAALSYFIISKYNSNYKNYEELTEFQNRELAKSYSLDVSKYGPSIEMYPSLNGSTLRLFGATNIKSANKLTVEIEGVPDTLLGRFQYNYKAEVTVQDGQLRHELDFSNKNHLAKDQVMGEYTIRITCADCKDSSLKSDKVYEKTFFLGGVKDSSYDAQLLKYNKELRKKAVQEINQYRQLVKLVQGFLLKNSATTKKVRLDKETESLIHYQLKQFEIAKNEGSLFYTELYKMVLDIDPVLMSLEQNSDDKSQIDTKLALLKSQRVVEKINELEEAPLSSNGRPLRY